MGLFGNKKRFNVKAIYEDEVIAESNETIRLEGSYYFPIASVKKEFLKDSPTHTICPWKGVASYYHIQVHGKKLENGAWYYPAPGLFAKSIKGMVAFDDPIQIIKDRLS